MRSSIVSISSGASGGTSSHTMEPAAVPLRGLHCGEQYFGLSLRYFARNIDRPVSQGSSGRSFTLPLSLQRLGHTARFRQGAFT